MKANPSGSLQSLGKYAPRLAAIGLLALCLLWLLNGCKYEAAALPGPNPAGEYALVRMDGQAVPGTLHHGDTAMTVHSGTMMLTADRQGTSRMIVSVGGQKNRVIVRDAKFTQSGTNLTLRWKNAGQTIGHLSGNTFTMKNEGMTLVYQK